MKTYEVGYVLMAYVHAKFCENLLTGSKIVMAIPRHYSDLVNLISVLEESKVG
jgi:hypothetical protein